jgi:hypothetical protein
MSLLIVNVLQSCIFVGPVCKRHLQQDCMEYHRKIYVIFSMIAVGECIGSEPNFVNLFELADSLQRNPYII